MHSTDSITSIARLDDYSGGLSASNYITQWLQEQSEEGASWNYADISNAEHDVKVFYTIRPYEETDTELYRPDIAIVKAICHLVVERIPDQALPELAESMGRILEFYRETPKGPPALSAPSRQMRAKAGRKYERPSFDLPEE